MSRDTSIFVLETEQMTCWQAKPAQMGENLYNGRVERVVGPWIL